MSEIQVTASELQRVFDLQRANQWNIKSTSAALRREKLERLKTAVIARAQDIVDAVRRDTRKPEAEVQHVEVQNLIANIQRNIDNLERWMEPTDVAPSLNPADRAQIVMEARGVCLILGPWNFPLGLTFGPLAAAIAAGNCCVVKLTDLCPATAKVAGEIIRDTFEENEVALFEGDVSVATALLDLPFNHIFFTGSTRVGRLVMAAAARHLSSVTLELGGKSPVIVDADANIELVAQHLAAAKQLNAGQACICPDYVFVPTEKIGLLIEKFGEAVASRTDTESKQIPKENIAQIVNKQNFDRVKSLVDDATAKGATIAYGGSLDATDFTIYPTMLVGVRPDMTILQDEIFAPVLPVVTYDNLDDVIRHISDRDKPLALYIFSGNQANIEKILQGTSSGGVTINGFFSHYLENNLPFGGVNQSGLGSYHGEFGFKAFSHERAIYSHQ
ncbi:aldehyde dehydrogenase family protein [Novosphingobium sp.]|uniref:aldehyde dehydrogenase family protein n=1 Tax=Novosphingobium sp. TaxID=1874826 RepID=UPI002635A354|nr:aldehyde dehydrogenase family protein [Novosphingobium sp.]